MRRGKGSYEFVMNESVLGNFSGISLIQRGWGVTGRRTGDYMDKSAEDGGKAGPKEQIHT
jgi:hypothetical protein